MGALLMTEAPEGPGGHTVRPARTATTTVRATAKLVWWRTTNQSDAASFRSAAHAPFEKLPQISSPSEA